jgi:hypothetical protein
MELAMKLLPYDNLTLHTPLSPVEVIARVKSVTTQTGSTFVYWGLSIPDGFIGSVNENSFSISFHRRFRKNSFRPVVNGAVEPGVGGSIINLKMRMNLFVVISLAVWFMLALAACAITLSQFFANPGAFTVDSLDLLIPLGMVVFFYGAILISFHSGSKSARETLESLLQARVVENWS